MHYVSFQSQEKRELSNTEEKKDTMRSGGENASNALRVTALHRGNLINFSEGANR